MEKTLFDIRARAKANGAKPTLCEMRAALATIYDIKGIVLQSRVQAEYYGEDGFVYSKIVRLIEKYEREHFAEREAGARNCEED